MDADILDAVAVVDIDPARAAEWFGLIDGAHSASGGDWDKFSERLTSTAGGAFGTAVRTFLGYAADHGKTDLIGKLVANLRELPSAYASGRERAAEPRSGSPWDTVVREFGSGWAGWDGSEKGWAQFRDWTYSSANAQAPTLYAAAYEKLNPLGDLPLPDRVATLTGFGFTITKQSAQPTESPWAAVVRQFGPGWANWDGSDAGWVALRDWTYSSANAQDPAMYGAAYEKLNPLNGLPTTERAAALTELGFAVAASAAQPTVQPVVAASAGASSMDQIIADSVAEALLEVPGSESLTPEQLARMRTEIAEELAREEAQ